MRISSRPAWRSGDQWAARATRDRGMGDAPTSAPRHLQALIVWSAGRPSIGHPSDVMDSATMAQHVAVTAQRILGAGRSDPCSSSWASRRAPRRWPSSRSVRPRPPVPEIPSRRRAPARRSRQRSDRWAATSPRALAPPGAGGPRPEARLARACGRLSIYRESAAATRRRGDTSWSGRPWPCLQGAGPESAESARTKAQEAGTYSGRLAEATCLRSGQGRSPPPRSRRSLRSP